MVGPLFSHFVISFTMRFFLRRFSTPLDENSSKKEDDIALRIALVCCEREWMPVRLRKSPEGN
jgi:hypothetical protein